MRPYQYGLYELWLSVEIIAMMTLLKMIENTIAMRAIMNETKPALFHESIAARKDFCSS